MEIYGDFDTTVEKALSEIDENWKSYEGLIICGTHKPKEWELLVLKLKQARERNLPTLGICFGLQMMIVEWARHIKGWEDAQSTEIQLTKHPVVAKRRDLRVGIYPVNGRMESHWHWYQANPYWTDIILDYDFEVTRTDEVVEEIKLKEHLFYQGTQYHPEYQSSKEKPHPLLVKFLQICKNSR